MPVSWRISVQAVGPDACPSGTGLFVISLIFKYSTQRLGSERLYTSPTAVYLFLISLFSVFPCFPISLLAQANFSYFTSYLFILQVVTCAL